MPPILKALDEGFLGYWEIFDLVPDIAGSSPSATSLTMFTDPEGILDPDLPNAPDLSLTGPTRLEKQETAPLVLTIFRDTFPSVLNSSCTMDLPLSSQFEEQILQQRPVKSGIDGEPSRRLAISLGKELNEAKPTSTPEDIPAPDLPNPPNTSLLYLPPMEELMTASLPLARSSGTFPSNSNSSCTTFQSPDSRSADQVLSQLPVESGSGFEDLRRLATRFEDLRRLVTRFEDSRQLATRFEEDANGSRPVAMKATKEDARVHPPKRPDHFATMSAHPTSPPKRRKSSPVLSKYSGQPLLLQNRPGAARNIGIPFLLITIISFVLAIVQVILPEVSSPYLCTALTFPLEDYAKDSGFVSLGIRDHQEAFNKFNITVSSASRANDSISETGLNVQKVVRRIWQVNESYHHQLHSSLSKRVSQYPSYACSSPRLATYTHRLQKHFDNVWKRPRMTPYSRSMFPGLFKRHQDGFRSPLLKYFQLARYFQKMHHSFSGFFEDCNTGLGNSEVGRYSLKSFVHEEFYFTMVPLPTWPLSKRSTAHHEHLGLLSVPVPPRWRSGSPFNQGWLDSKQTPH